MNSQGNSTINTPFIKSSDTTPTPHKKLKEKEKNTGEINVNILITTSAFLLNKGRKQ